MTVLRIWLTCFVFLVNAPVSTAQKRCINYNDLSYIQFIMECTLSPDGNWIALSARQNQTGTCDQDIYLLNHRGGSARRLTTSNGFDGSPRFSPDGSLLAFLSDRSGTRQIHMLPMNGGEAQPVSDVPAGISDYIWSPDGNLLAYTALPESLSVLSEPVSVVLNPNTEALNCPDPDPLCPGPGCRHIFIMPFTGGPSWDLMQGSEHTFPVVIGDPCHFSFSPDSREILFVRYMDSTQTRPSNLDIYAVPSHGGTLKQISTNPGNEDSPLYSPDHRYIACRSTRRPGETGDQTDILLKDRFNGRIRNLTENFDLDVNEMVWTPDSDHIYFTAWDQGRLVIFHVDVKTGKIKGTLLTGTNTNLMISPDGNRLYFVRSRAHMPPEIFTCNLKGEQLEQISFLNHRLVNQIEMNPIHDFWFSSFDGKLVHGFLIKPPFFDPARKVPGVLLIRNDTHSASQDCFKADWNAQMFAKNGYAVIMINMRGARGYGREFSDAVSKNWGGSPYRDLMHGLDYVIREFPFVDETRIAAVGSGYGGYMIDWIAGHTQRFQCLVSHAGIFDPVSFYGSARQSDEMDWEFGGTPYDNYKQYEKWSPVKFVKNIKTPVLIIHGTMDEKIPFDQSVQFYTALQKQHVESRFLILRKEGHKIRGAENMRTCWETVLNWIGEHTKEDMP
ncbi:S9 family peptidase [bacterium]|nr:S9 family peptidase [bacterium]